MRKLVIGQPPALDLALLDWKRVQPGMELIAVTLPQNESRQFDFSALSAYEPSSTTAFIAWDDQFLNLRRMEIFTHIKKRGFSLPPLIHPQALLDARIDIPENVWIHQAAKAGTGVTIGLNVVVGFGASLQPGCHIMEHVMINEGAVIGAGSKVGSFVTIGANVVIDSETKIGNFSRLTQPRRYRGSYPEGTYKEDRFEAQILS